MAAVVLADQEMVRIEGAYWADDLAAVLRVGRHEGTLRLRMFGQRLEMIHVGEGRFRVPAEGRAMRFEPAAGAVERMRFWYVGEEEDAKSAEKLALPRTDERALREFAGDYRSPELPVTYHIELTQGQLSVRWLKRDPVELTLAAQDLLIGDHWVVGHLRFQRDAGGQITGFTLDAGPVRNFRFERAP